MIRFAALIRTKRKKNGLWVVGLRQGDVRLPSGKGPGNSMQRCRVGFPKRGRAADRQSGGRYVVAGETDR